MTQHTDTDISRRMASMLADRGIKSPRAELGPVEMDGIWYWVNNAGAVFNKVDPQPTPAEAEYANGLTVQQQSPEKFEDTHDGGPVHDAAGLAAVEPSPEPAASEPASEPAAPEPAAEGEAHAP